MTDLEIAELSKSAEYITILKNKLELDTIANIDGDIKTLTINNVTEDNRNSINTVITNIKAVLTKSETTSSQKTLLNSKIR